MAVRVVRLGTARERDEGLRLGTVRLLPRGVKKQDYAKLNYFDVWLPEVSPSRALVSYARAKPWTDARWAAYTRRYLREMRRPEARRSDHAARGVIEAGEFFDRLLLRESPAMSSFAAGRAVARAGREGPSAFRVAAVTRCREIFVAHQRLRISRLKLHSHRASITKYL